MSERKIHVGAKRRKLHVKGLLDMKIFVEFYLKSTR